VQNRFCNFGSVSVRFLKKTLIWFEMSLVRFRSKNAVRFGFIVNITATVDDVTLTSLTDITHNNDNK